MSVQVSANNNTVPFIRLAVPGALKQDAIIAKDTGRSAALAPLTVLGKIKKIIGTVTADAGNTGDGTVTGYALALGKALVGSYNLECTVAVTHGGTFKLVDPNGNIIANDLVITAGAGLATTFIIGGLTFIITDGATDFIVGDKFALTVTVGAGYLPLDPAAVNGLEEFAGIYLGASITAAAIVAAAISDNQILVGDAYVDKNQLVFENSITLATLLPNGKTLEEEMASLGIFSEDTVDISSFEN